MKTLLISLFTILLSTPVEETGQTKIIRVLFVGNSLTYTNNLPKLVEEEAATKGLVIQSEMIAKPNYALEDHWNEGIVRDRILNKRYDFVIVQQGPSSQSEGRKMLLDYGARISKLCEEGHARLVFFMVWPAHVNRQTFDGVIRNYSDAAIATNAILCPVGKVWKDHFDSTGDLSYYGPDQFHPSLTGSQTAAKVIVDALLEATR